MSITMIGIYTGSRGAPNGNFVTENSGRTWQKTKNVSNKIKKIYFYTCIVFDFLIFNVMNLNLSAIICTFFRSIKAQEKSLNFVFTLSFRFCGVKYLAAFSVSLKN